MRLLITRPEHSAARFAERVQALGAEPIVAPLLEIVLTRTDTPSLEGVRALIFTSANGVRAYADLTRDRAPAVYAVGDATARAASEAGFGEVVSADGDAHDLTRVVRETLPADGGALLHLSGEHVAGSVVEDLEAAGYVVRREPVYRAVACSELPEVAVRALRTRTIDAAAFFSPRTAATFVNLVSRARLDDGTADATAFCLSAAVAERLATGKRRPRWAKIAVADRPTEDHMEKLIFTAFARTRDA